jgi:hypothetical protein
MVLRKSANKPEYLSSPNVVYVAIKLLKTAQYRAIFLFISLIETG